MAGLQAQLSDALNDAAMARRREDAARGEASKLSTMLETVQEDDAQRTDAEFEISEARRKEEEAHAKRAAAEAVVRRLDNERAYLRSQLTSEVTLKNELTETLDNATRQLAEFKIQVSCYEAISCVFRIE